jgi:hypothetical protein
MAEVYKPITFFDMCPKDCLETVLKKYIRTILTLCDRYYLDKKHVFYKCIVNTNGIIFELSCSISCLYHNLETVRFQAIDIHVDSSFTDVNVEFNINPNIDIRPRIAYYSYVHKNVDEICRRIELFENLPRIPLSKQYHIAKIRESLYSRRNLGTSSKKLLHALIDNYKLSYIPCPFVDILMNDDPTQIAAILNLLFKKKQNLGKVEEFCIMPYVTLSKVSEYEFKLTIDENFVEIFNILSSFTVWSMIDYYQLNEDTTVFNIDRKKGMVDLVIQLRDTISSIKKVFK